MAKVAVIGAAGYVGQEVCAGLKRDGHSVTGIARFNGKMLLERIGIEVVHPDDVGSAGPFDVVINLAFPNSGPGYESSEKNREIVKLVTTLASGGCGVIHVSTLAVFGFALEHPVEPAPVMRRRDYSYIESKVEMEHLLAAALPASSLQVVRLGNVWGPASPSWTAALAEKVLFGDPVGIHGQDGYSNVTDVANVASYLSHLVSAENLERRGFHHLAEFSETRWSYWTSQLGNALGIAPITYSGEVNYADSAWTECRSLLSVHSPIRIAKEAMRTRFLGSWIRQAISSLPSGQMAFLKRKTAGGIATLGVGGDDALFLTILGARKRCHSHVLPGWTAPVDLDASWERTRSWMKAAGYL